MNKKLQVFVSSTYTDLIEERQTAVEAILDAGHIPAGMELFKAGKSQMKTIRKWIDESDVYMLILGGRYGSIEEESGLSYTELEYRYALSKNMPVFAIVLNDSFLFTKAASNGKDCIFEKKNKQKYNLFKKYVETNIVKFVDNVDVISSVIHSHLNYIQSEFKDTLCGWIKYTDNRYSYDDENTLATLTKSYNNLLDKYNNISQRFETLSIEYKEQMYKIANINQDKEIIRSMFREYCNNNSTEGRVHHKPLYNPNNYRTLEKLLDYSKITMYEYRFRIIKLKNNFYSLKRNVEYTLEDFFMVIYQLSFCSSPLDDYSLDKDDKYIFLECMTIFFRDKLFKPCDILTQPFVLTIEPKGHEVYRYLVANHI